MSFFWQHNGDLSRPPEPHELKRRRPWGGYWESDAATKETALETFWTKWKRKTGKEYPRTPPKGKTPSPAGFVGNRVVKSRRPDHQAEKKLQDANE